MKATVLTFVALMLALFGSSTQALSSLKSRVNNSQELQDRKLEIEAPKAFEKEDYEEEGFTMDQVKKAKKFAHRLRESVIYNRVDPFSATPEFEFFDSFVLGLELESFYESSTECLDAVVYFIDDWAYLQNNITIQDTPVDPVLNFTAIISGNLSVSTYECYVFGYSVYDYTKTSIEGFSGVDDWLLSFLFNQMGKALSFKYIFDEIESDREQQYYSDIAFQYGKLIKLIFDFESIDEGALEPYGLSHEQSEMYIDGAREVINEGITFLVESQQTQDMIQRTKEYGSEQLLSWYPTTWADGGWMAAYFAYGAVDVLPDDGFVNLCKDVFVEDGPTTYYAIRDHFNDGDYEDMMEDVATMMTYLYAATFNCYYGMEEQLTASTYEALFGESHLILNLLFNVGMQYQDVNYIITYWNDEAGFLSGYTGSLYDGFTYWQFLGYAMGDFFIRWFYREYYTDITLDLSDFSVFDYN